MYPVKACCKKGHDPQSHLCFFCFFATFLLYVDLRELTDTNAILADRNGRVVSREWKQGSWDGACVWEKAKFLCETRCCSEEKNACYLIVHLSQNWFSHRMKNFFSPSTSISFSLCCMALLLFIGSVIPKWLWWDVIWRLPELCQDAFSDGSPSSVGLCLPGEYLPSAFSKYGATMYFRGRLDVITLLCWSMMRKQCKDCSFSCLRLCL